MTHNPLPTGASGNIPDQSRLGREERRRLRFRAAGVGVLLLLAVGLVFGRTVFHDFINFDDHDYVRDNPPVAGGLSLRGVSWAFTQRHASNWHPVTWLSHMLDSQVYGLRAGGHHLTSVLLHAGASLLLFIALQQMTGHLWAAAFAAALFAIHPLRVESVAWVAERKDVLSGLFFMLTLRAYSRHVRCPASAASRRWLIVLYALGLMSKPMLVTLPLVLLLLDYWPLGRMRKVSFVTLVREKVPLLALALVSSGLSLWAQQKALLPGDQLPFAWRLGNALVAYVTYAGKFFYPADLAVFYPHPGPALPAGAVVAAALAMLAATAGVLARTRRNPHLLVGWLWYVGMLVPVIGLVQVGEQAMADRYTYLPQIGLSVAVAWTGAAAMRTRLHRRWLPFAALASIVLLAGAAWLQAGHWRDDEALFTHALGSTSRNHVAHNNLGKVLAGRGETGKAIAHYRDALAIRPDYALAHNNLGLALADRGNIDEAIAHYRKALEIRPDYGDAHINLGADLVARGQIDEAVAHFRMALEVGPNQATAHYNLGVTLADRGHADEAISHYRKALEIKPDYVEARINLSFDLAALGQVDEAIVHCRKILELATRHGDHDLAERTLRRLAVYEKLKPLPR